MALGMASNCINHPGVEAAARCKQCNKPVCSACVVKGPTGNFCSQACKERNESFVQRAATLDSMRRPSTFGTKLKRLVGKLIVVLILLIALGVAGSLMNIPVLTKAVMTVRGIIGL